MSDEPAASPDNSSKPETESAPAVRRISNPRPKKAARSAAPPPEAVEPADEVQSIPFPTSKKSEQDAEPEAPSQDGADWPEPEAESAGGVQSPAEAAKRKRRRRKGKGQSTGAQNGHGAPVEEVHTVASPEPKSADAPHEQRPRPAQGTPPQQQQPQRPKIDPETLTKMAWKIYLAEVSEEGVALIGDNDARDLSRRCFRLAEIFIEEQTRRR